MKKYILHPFSFSIVFCLLLAVSNAQSQGLNYQAVARNNAGTALINQAVSVRFTIHEGSPTGIIRYQETGTTTTNALGIFTVVIGGGSMVQGNFEEINWGSGTKLLQVEFDPAGGTAYTDMGTSRMMSVPYALSSATTSSVIGDTNYVAKYIDKSHLGSSLIYDNGSAVAIGTATPAPSASLDITSSTGALLLPRLTTTERNALSPSEGMMIYNKQKHKFEGYTISSDLDREIDTGATTIPRSIVGGGFWVMHQSFRAGTSGNISRVVIITDNTASATGTLDILAGDGTAGAVLYSDNFNYTNCTNSNCETVITLSTPFPVVSNSFYTLRFSTGNGFSFSTYTNGSDPYSNGQAYQNSSLLTNEDMYLRIYIDKAGWVELH